MTSQRDRKSEEGVSISRRLIHTRCVSSRMSLRELPTVSGERRSVKRSIDHINVDIRLKINLIALLLISIKGLV